MTNRNSLRLYLLLAGLVAVLTHPLSGQEIIPAQHLFDITGGFNQPSDVAVGEKGRIYVVDGVNNRIRVFEADGTHVATVAQEVLVRDARDRD